MLLCMTMAYTVMADMALTYNYSVVYIVMAYTVMAGIVLAYVVMAYAVMASI